MFFQLCFLNQDEKQSMKSFGKWVSDRILPSAKDACNYREQGVMTPCYKLQSSNGRGEGFGKSFREGKL